MTSTNKALLAIGGLVASYALVALDCVPVARFNSGQPIPQEPKNQETPSSKVGQARPSFQIL